MINLNNYAENHGKKNITMFVLIDLKKRDQGRCCIGNENKTTYTECTPKQSLFKDHKCCIQLKIEMIWKN